MKKTISIKLIVLTVAVIFAGIIFSNTSMASTAKVTVETANLREEANSTSKVLELISMGEDVEVVETQDNWYKVKYKNITGYLRNDLIQVVEEEKEETVTEEQPTENTDNSNEQQTEENKPSEEQQSTTTQETNSNSEMQTGTYNTKENIKIKIIPLINAIQISEINAGEKVEVTETKNNWARITTSNGVVGWTVISKLEKEESTEEQPTEQTPENNVTTDESNTSNNQQQTKTMYINSQTVNFREKADKNSTVIKQLDLNTEVTVLSETDGWYQVKVGNDTGYIAFNLLSDSKQETTRSNLNDRDTTTNVETTVKQETTNTETAPAASTTTATTTNATRVSSKGSEVVEYAKGFLGYPYVYGGTSTSGFDCSGFTQYVFKHFGVSINRTAQAQYSNGTSVTDVAKLQIGDLVMFGTSASNINHVGIYMGGSRFIHAANQTRGITTDTLASGYYKTYYIGARRIF